MNKERKSILCNIAQIRKNKGYSQEYLAAQIGLKQAGYALIEKGERGLSYDLLLQIAIALEMDVIDLITYPKRYKDISQVAFEGDTGKVAILFEVPTKNKAALMKMVLDDE